MKNTKQSLSLIGVAFLCVSLYFFFPVSSVFQDLVAVVTLLWLIPYLYMRFILKEHKERFGWHIGNWRTGVMWAVLSFFSALVVLLLLIRFTSLLSDVTFPVLLQQNFITLILYLIVMVVYVVIFESFFRGFIINGLSDNYGLLVIPFSLFLMIFVRDIDVYSVGFYVIAPFACLTAYYSKSLYYSLAASVLFMIVSTSIILNFV